ncbi:Hsp70 family protein [Gluconacetobacter sacchari]|uniref:Hsp70 family protein n=2 Tax=Gluconacetobacter sacchari TaxID=92759 RepID=A0A7W4IDR1_9PROT|nr:Hsp70 family protein [Gluconacetobacter sacchari]MBB2160973.1 Hsp70 family protein [Gluconacetobacter sacchari]
MLSPATAPRPRVGIDFGTTNSVVVIATPNGETHTVRFAFAGHPESETCRTLLCLWQEEQRGRLAVHRAIGAAAIDAYLDDPAESRLIMSMKSYLAQTSFRETRLLGRRLTLENLIGLFVAELIRSAGIDPTETDATVGRPVRFAGEAPDDAFGEQRLRDGFAEAGFGSITVALEPEAAGWRFARRLDAPATILVGDFGGGTSDFSVLRFDPAIGRAIPLGHAGVGIAGDQFDYRIIDNVVSPELGRDSTYRIMGGAPLPVPIEWYASLARWHRLSLMRTPATLRAIDDVARTASAPDRLHALATLVADQQGQALYRAVGAAKTELSQADSTTLRFHHKDIHIERTITRAAFEDWIAPDLAKFDGAVNTALERAGLAEADIDRVFLTGGTSFVPAVRALFAARFGTDRIDRGGEFVSVAEGLALMQGERARRSDVPGPR